MRVGSLGQEDPLEEGMATHSSILAWSIPWTEETGGLVHGVTKSPTLLKRLNTTHSSVKTFLTVPPRKCTECLSLLLSRTPPCLLHSSVSMPDPPPTWRSSWPCSQVKPLPWCDE